jgi:hypothetical protein
MWVLKLYLLLLLDQKIKKVLTTPCFLVRKRVFAKMAYAKEEQMLIF